ncbi:MAG TPA: DUF2071 domain-containing protein [Lentimicrobium sp.]|nr:DUF2071 domain-containing protein [Lentimicrobium sp.]
MAKTLEIPWTNYGRPFPYPNKPWTGYQEWHNVIYLHWKVETETLRKVVPNELEIDTFNGQAYLSVVPFSVRKLRQRFIIPLPPISDFEELNVRTYVKYNGVPGIYFFSLEASKWAPVVAARFTTRLPYVNSEIWREEDMYYANSKKFGFEFHINFKLEEKEITKDLLTSWLTDRFRLYVKTSGHINCIDVHHHPWVLKPLVLRYLKLNYMIGGFPLSKQAPDLTHFSDGVKVVTWRRKRDL